MKNIKHNVFLDEYMYFSEHDSGIKCCVIPKHGYVGKQALIGVNYGSIDSNGTPAGIAHYLEHKLFDDENGNVFDKFSSLGVSVNAFTSFTTTAYYFNCTNNFDKSFDLLLDFVQNPHFTDEGVEKERGIIEQEINMYKDDPVWRVYFNMLDGMYHNPCFKENIAGSTESIGNITKELLIHCYSKYYTPKNMFIICCGDLEAEEIYSVVDNRIKYTKNKDIKRIFTPEPKYVNKSYIDSSMPIFMPLFYIGYKDVDNETDKAKKTAAIKVLIDILAGDSSSLYERMYNEGLINENFSIEYVSNMFFGNSIFSGFSKNPSLVAEMLVDEVKALMKKGIDESRFNRIKKKHIGRFIRGFNSIESLLLGQVDCFSKGADIFKSIDSYVNLNEASVKKQLYQHLNPDMMTLSVINPI